jgi:hypothetical protein
VSHIAYPFEQIQPTRYKFFSLGTNKIEKIVDFVPVIARNVMNLGFGDLLPGGSVDDKITSNNGDIRRVLATVAMIAKHFTTLYPHTIILFFGSTEERTRVYARILKIYYTEFRREFVIYGITGTAQEGQRLPFDPCAQIDYIGFLIKRIA